MASFFFLPLTWGAEKKSVVDEGGLVLDLKEAIRRTLAYAPDLEVAAQEQARVEGKLKEASRARFLPQARLRVLGGPVPDVPAGVGPTGGFPDYDSDFWNLGPFVRIKFEALQPIYTFGKIAGAIEAAKRGLSAKKAQVAAVHNELVHRVKRAYFGLCFLYSLGDFVEELKNRAEKAKKQVEKQIKKNSPDVTDIDLMRLTVFLAETEKRLIEVNAGIEFALTSLKIITGIPVERKIGIADNGIRLRKVDLAGIDHYWNLAQTSRPEIHQLREAVAIRRALKRVSKADFFPSFFFGGFYGYSLAPGREDVENPYLNDDFNFHTGGVALGFEQKLGFHLTSARYDQAVAEFLKIQAEKRQAMQGIEIQVRHVHSTCTAKQEAVKASRRAFKAGRSWVLASTLNFGVGLTPVKDLLEAFLAYSKVKASYFDMVHEFEIALADLSKVVGQEVTGLEY